MIEAITRVLAGNGKVSVARLAPGPGSPPARGGREGMAGITDEGMAGMTCAEI